MLLPPPEGGSDEFSGEADGVSCEARARQFPAGCDDPERAAGGAPEATGWMVDQAGSSHHGNRSTMIQGEGSSTSAKKTSEAGSAT